VCVCERVHMQSRAVCGHILGVKPVISNRKRGERLLL
jgi:hypothetical protein